MIRFLLILILLVSRSMSDGAIEEEEEDRAAYPLPLLILPGFASTQLYSWRQQRCSALRSFEAGSRIWLDISKPLVHFTKACWLRCMSLSVPLQRDLPGACSARPAKGIESIAELDPGIVTGPLSTVWARLHAELVERFDYDSMSLQAAPYDFRLSPRVLDERDDYFHSLMTQIEAMMRSAERRGFHDVPGVGILAHSLGNNVFRYFLRWLDAEFGARRARRWIDANVALYIGVGSPLLGAAEAIKAVFEGETFGMPLTNAEVRGMCASFASAPWMLPVVPHDYRDEHDAAVWPTEHVAELQLGEPATPTPSGAAAASEQSSSSAAAAARERAVLTFTAAHTKQLIAHAARFDETIRQVHANIEHSYSGDPIFDALDEPWRRPPIRQVVNVYGRNLPTKVAFRFQKPPAAEFSVDSAQPWRRVATTTEDGPTLYTEDARTGAVYDFSSVPTRKSGDGTVPYASLAWAHRWLDTSPTAVLNVTDVPQSFYDDVPPSSNAEQQHGDASNGEPMISFYETSSADGGELTAVWEIDGAVHRDIIYHPTFVRELEHLLMHMSRTFRPSHQRRRRVLSFASKQARPPATDADCRWDYGRIRCAFSQFCHYRFEFGDLTLDQSCRLRDDLAVALADDNEQLQHIV
jgi:Lecithin:cholesterol acyltransferase